MTDSPQSNEKSEKTKDDTLVTLGKGVIELRDALFPVAQLLQERVNKAARQFQPLFDRLAEVGQQIQPVFLALHELEKKYRPQIIAFIEAMERYETFNAALVESHKKDSLAIPPFFNEFTAPEIFELFKDPEKAAIDVYLDYFSQKQHLEALLESWSTNKYFEDRVPILRDALTAHVERKHTLSIPTLLSQAEGILCNIFDVRDHAKVKGKLNNVRFDDEDKEDNLFANAQMVARIITEQVFQSSKKSETKQHFPNRHPVLHGGSIDYYKDEYASLRCILLLDFIRSENFLALNGKRKMKE